MAYEVGGFCGLIESEMYGSELILVVGIETDNIVDPGYAVGFVIGQPVILIGTFDLDQKDFVDILWDASF